MTDTTTADVLAAMRLIMAHGLSVNLLPLSGWEVSSQCRGVVGTYKISLIAAVRAWAEAAGVEWKPPKVVPMFAAVDAFGPGIREMFLTRKEAEDNCEFWRCGTVVPCVVVIRNETEWV